MGRRTGKILLVWALGVVLCAPGLAAAMVINFDSNIELDGHVPTDYLGFSWGANWWTIKNSSFQSNWFNTGDFPSLPNAAHNSGLTTLAISFPALYDVTSAHFRSWSWQDTFYDSSARRVTVKAYRGISLEGTRVVDLSPGAMVLTPLNFDGVDKLEFITEQFKSWLVDDITINQVPLPGALVLLGVGIVRLVAYSRRRRSLA
ncbi:MAG: hypothetical protein ACOZFS_00050 [Thermodesulfobacteriota bacterium]